MAYFRLANPERMFRDLDRWLRRRLRQIRWKEWKTTAAKRHNLRIRGISERNARKSLRLQGIATVVDLSARAVVSMLCSLAVCRPILSSPL